MRVRTNLLKELEREFLPPEGVLYSARVAPLSEKKEIPWKRLLLILLLGVVIGTGLLGLYYYLKDKPSSARFLGLGIPVETVTVKGEALTEIIGANGKTEPADTVEIKTSVGSKVLSVFVEVGAAVSKDQVLVQLDPAPHKAALKEAQEKFSKAKTNVEKSESVEKRMNELFGRKLISSTELEKVTRELNVAQTHFSDAAERFLTAKDNLDKVVITAKTAGMIVERKINSGEIVNPKDILFVLGTTESVQVVAFVPKEKGDHVIIGQEADIVLDAYPNTIITGEVEKIDPVDDPTSKMKVSVRIKSALKIKAGLPAYVWIKSHRKGLTIPKLSVIQMVNGTPTSNEAVFVVENFRARRQTIRTGATRKNKVEVLEGLMEGQEVVSVGLSRLQDNDRVILKGVSK